MDIVFCYKSMNGVTMGKETKQSPHAPALYLPAISNQIWYPIYFTFFISFKSKGIFLVKKEKNIWMYYFITNLYIFLIKY